MNSVEELRRWYQGSLERMEKLHKQRIALKDEIIANLEERAKPDVQFGGGFGLGLIAGGAIVAILFLVQPYLGPTQ